MRKEKQSAAKKKYDIKYKAAHYKRVALELTIEKHEQVKAAAASQGESVNGYIKKAIDSRLDSGA